MRIAARHLLVLNALLAPVGALAQEQSVLFVDSQSLRTQLNAGEPRQMVAQASSGVLWPNFCLTLEES